MTRAEGTNRRSVKDQSCSMALEQGPSEQGHVLPTLFLASSGAADCSRAVAAEVRDEGSVRPSITDERSETGEES